MKLVRVVRRAGASRRIRLVQLVALAGLLVGLGGIAATSGAGADTGTTGSSGAGNTNTYNLSAQANALDVLLTDPSLPLSGDLNYEVGPWGASASLDSLGESISDAGAPYSPSIASLPGTINGLGAGNFPPLPPIPGYVSASYPSRKASIQSQAGYDIAATAQANSSKGAVGLGTQPAGSPNDTFFANAETTANQDGSVTLSASAGMDVIDFGQLLDVGNVSSSLSMTQQANQQPKVTSKTSLGTITLLGTSTGLLGNGVSALGVGVPIDLNTEVIGTLNTVLAKSGFKLTYLPVTYTYTDGSTSTGSTPDGSKTLQAVDSGALQVTYSQNMPSQGQVTLSETLGRVYVSTTDTPGIGPTTGNSGVVGNTGGGTAASAASSPAVIGNTGTVTGNSGSVSTAGNSGGASSTAPTGSSTTQALASGPAFLVEHGPPIESVYLVLVLAALGLLLASQAARYLAVRLALSGRGQ